MNRVKTRLFGFWVQRYRRRNMTYQSLKFRFGTRANYESPLKINKKLETDLLKSQTKYEKLVLDYYGQQPDSSYKSYQQLSKKKAVEEFKFPDSL